MKSIFYQNNEQVHQNYFSTAQLGINLQQLEFKSISNNLNQKVMV